jgi:hypothetical protein
MSPPSGSDDGSFTREVGTQTGKAVLLIVVAVLVAVLLLHHTSGTTSTPKVTKAPSATVPATSTTTAALVPPSQIKLLVLNGTGKGVLAGQFTTKEKQMGYQTQAPDNTTSVVDSSTVYAVTPQYAAEAQFLAQQLGLPPTAVVTNLPADAPIATGEKTIANLILVVGPDLANKA